MSLDVSSDQIRMEDVCMFGDNFRLLPPDYFTINNCLIDCLQQVPVTVTSGNVSLHLTHSSLKESGVTG